MLTLSSSDLILSICYQIYMASVSDAKTAVASSAGWFKVSQSGLVSDNPDYWAVQVLNVWLISYSPGNNVIHIKYRITAVTTPSKFPRISHLETISSALKSSVSYDVRR